jgi:hypothetical protein
MRGSAWMLLSVAALAWRCGHSVRPQPGDQSLGRKAIADQLGQIPPCAPDVEARASPTVSAPTDSPPKLTLIRGHLEIRGGYGCEPEAGLCEGPWVFVPSAPGQEVFVLSPRGDAEPFLWEAPESALEALVPNQPLLEVVVNGRPDRRPFVPDRDNPIVARELWFDSLCAVRPNGGRQR